MVSRTTPSVAARRGLQLGGYEPIQPARAAILECLTANEVLTAGCLIAFVRSRTAISPIRQIQGTAAPR